MPRRTPKPLPPNPPRARFALFLLIFLLLASTAACLYLARQRNTAALSASSSTTEAADLVSENRIIYAGLPQATAADAEFEVLHNSAYIVGYSESRKDPLWSAYRIFHNPNPYHLPRPTSKFETDTRTSALTKDSDFARSGFDRGHMAPNSAIEHCFGPDAQLETFLLTNICPQAPHLNREVWEKLETRERQYADEFEEIWVIDGPIFADLDGGSTERLPAGEAVPAAFYKILIDDRADPNDPQSSVLNPQHSSPPPTGHPRTCAVIMPQTVSGTELPQQFTTSIQQIESRTHLQFFSKLPADIRTPLESAKSPLW